MHTFFSRNFIATTVKKYWRSRCSSCAQNGIKLIVKWCRFPTPATNVVIVLYLSKITYYNDAIHFLAIDLTFLYAFTRFLTLVRHCSHVWSNPMSSSSLAILSYLEFYSSLLRQADSEQ